MCLTVAASSDNAKTLSTIASDAPRYLSLDQLHALDLEKCKWGGQVRQGKRSAGRFVTARVGGRDRGCQLSSSEDA
jgi:hypothetical protein